MTKDQQTQLLGAIGGLCRALGADLQPDAPTAKQVFYGLAYFVGRFLKTPDHARALAFLARDYMPADGDKPAPEPTAAPAGNDTEPHADLTERRKKWGLEGVRLHMTTDAAPPPADAPLQGPKPGDPF